MATTRIDVGKLKEGRFVMIEGHACLIRSTDHSKPGKHGGAKCRVTGIGIFDGTKREFVAPTGNEVEAPLLEKKKGQVLSLSGNKIQLMDLDTYETIEMDMPAEDNEAAKGLAEGATISYIEFEGKRKIMNVKED